MSQHSGELLVHTSPFSSARLTTPRLMLEVNLVLVPIIIASTWYFGYGALLVVAAATLGAVFIEWFFGPRGRNGARGGALHDGSAVLTGLLLGLTLPPGTPLWIAFVGGVVAIGLGKLAFGGLGGNMFNPALVGRAFLQAAFPTIMTTWNPQGGAAQWTKLRGSPFAAPLFSSDVDAITTATPLARMKFDGDIEGIWNLLVGNVPGSLGETSAILLILCGLWMGVRRLFDWRVPLAVLFSVALFSGLFHVISPANYPNPLVMLTSGGLLFGAVFMATDPATSPTAPRGAFIFGIGIGLLVVLIRLFGGLPEGVMYAILLMNAAVPLLERVTQPRVFGR